MNRIAPYVTPLIPAFVVIGFFVWFANWIPQTRWQPPQKQQISTALTPAELAQIGQTIVRQRGCLACHTIEPGAGVKGGGRGPNLAGIASRRAQGVKGGPENLVDYLAQALYEPGAYLVEGYANIMPSSTGAPAALGYEEVVAVIAYLQSLGKTPTVKVGDVAKPTSVKSASPSAKPAAVGAQAADPAALFASLGCDACHSLKAGETKVGPALDAPSLKQAAAERKMSFEAFLMESIVNPKAYEKKGVPSGVMPQDYGTRMNAAQLDALVRYLAAQGKQP
ncbi:MAG: c-type cytochrome [Betaproteobacteria bacterium]|nr:c-type cytochrome [Betaproteobacteria bacterium]